MTVLDCPASSADRLALSVFEQSVLVLSNQQAKEVHNEGDDLALNLTFTPVWQDFSFRALFPIVHVTHVLPVDCTVQVKLASGFCSSSMSFERGVHTSSSEP